MSVADAKVIIQQIPKTLESAGFNLTKFVVNHRDLLSEIPKICRAKEVRDFSPDAESRALGVKWKVSTDEFFFEVQRDLSDPVTRRIMLSITASISDPLGHYLQQQKIEHQFMPDVEKKSLKGGLSPGTQRVGVW